MVITPMDFWASAVPWEKDMKAAERICILRNPRLTPPGDLCCSIREKMTTKMKPAIVPRIGEMISARMIFFSPAHWRAEAPTCAMTEPISPPMMACDDEEGKP